ncbi:MAG: amidohydrolase family protein [Thermacetogeniaceae bacterium]
MHERLRKMVIDFHTHCFPDELARRAIPLLASRAKIKPHVDGTVTDLCRSMRKAGIFLSVVQPVATRPQQVRKINEWARGNQRRELLFFAAFHPDLERPFEEIKRIKDQGFKGIKLHPDYQEFFVDEERMFPIYEAIFNEELIILFHAGVDVGLPPPVHCTPKRLANVLRLFPGGKVIAAHMGGYLCWDEVERELLGKEVFFDTSFSFCKLGKERMRRMILEHGPEKILFATDSPWTDQSEEVANIRSLGLPEDLTQKILGLNAASLIGFIF